MAECSPRPPPAHWKPPFVRFEPSLLPPLPAVVDEDARRRVFVHKSALPARDQLSRDPVIREAIQIDCNQRLDWLGDSILGWLVSEYLYQHLPRASQGELDKLRQMITANRTLSHLAWQYRFDEHLQCKILETRRQDTDKDAMYDQKLYADAFEAYLAAAFQPIMMPDRLELLRQYIGALLSPSCAPDVWAAADQFHRLSLYGHAAATATGPLYEYRRDTQRPVKPVTPLSAEALGDSETPPESIRWIERQLGGGWEITVQVSGRDVLVAKGTKRVEAIQKVSTALLERLQGHQPSLEYLLQGTGSGA